MRVVQRRNRSLTFQQLERRFNLAGNVSVSVQNGLLKISGDAADNGVEVRYDSTSGQIRVRGLGPGVDGLGRVQSTSPTLLTVNGRQVAETMVAGVTSINAELGRGKDGLIVEGDLVALGAQFREVPLRLQSLLVDLGRGQNSLQVYVTSATNGLRVTSGGGDDFISTSNCIFAGVSSIVTNDGNDIFHAQGTGFTSLTFDAGRGNDFFSCLFFADESLPGCFFEQNLTITMGDGEDNVNLENTTILLTLSCSLGRNNDNFRIDRLTTARVYQVNGDGDRDALVLDAGVAMPAGFQGFETLVRHFD